MFQSLHAIAEDQASKESSRTYVISGMRAQREKLVSGHLIMRGEHVIRAKGELEHVDPIRFEISFDHASKSYCHKHSEVIRFRRGEARTPPNPNPETQRVKTADEVEWQVEYAGGTLVRTPEFDLHLALDSTVITRLLPGSAQGLMIYEPDVRCAGLLDLHAFKRSTSYQKALNAYESKLQVKDIHRNVSGLWDLTLRTSYIETEVWVDEMHGMTPIQVIVRDTREGLKERNRPETISTTDVSWKNVKDNWVPVSLMMSGTSPTGSFEQYELTLEWVSVNEPLDRKIFTAAGMVDSDNAIVMDMRLGPIVMEQVRPKPLSVAVSTPKPVTPKPPSWLGWIVLGHLVVGGGVAWWYYRRRSKRQSA